MGLLVFAIAFSSEAPLAIKVAQARFNASSFDN
jgi:hypothetical protein